MKLARIIFSAFLFIIFFTIFTPANILLKLFGKDLLNLKFNRKLQSYWILRKKNIGSMNKQF